MPIEWSHRLHELEAHAADFDHAVGHSAGIDPFCSSSDWLIPFHTSHAAADRLCWGHRDGHYVAWEISAHAELGQLAQPLENAWMFACPAVGPQHLDLLEQTLLGRDLDAIDAFVLSGRRMQADYRQSLRRIAAAFAIHPLRPTRRVIASLRGGLDAFWSRRSRNLRRNLRRSQKRADQHGVEMQRIVVDPEADIDALYERVLGVERRSWKSRQGVGVDRGVMRLFYDAMLRRLAARAGAMLIFARQGDRDLGYMHAGLFGSRARGFQFSYDQSEARLGLGNLLHAELISWLCERGVQTYDLGMWVAYKERWGEERMITPNFVLIRQRR